MSLTDPFASLIKTTTTVKKQVKNSVPEWDGEIPASALTLVQTALDNPNDRVLFPFTDVDKAIQLHSALNAAVAKLAPNKQIHTRHTWDENKENMVEFGFSIGEKRGRKTAAAS